MCSRLLGAEPLLRWVGVWCLQVGWRNGFDDVGRQGGGW